MRGILIKKADSKEKQGKEDRDKKGNDIKTRDRKKHYFLIKLESYFYSQY